MNILYYYRDSLSLMDSWQKKHFLDELKRMGHIVTIFNYLDYSNLLQANEELIACLKKGNWDLFMNAHGSDLLYPDSIKEIRAFGIPSLLICFDNLHAPFMHKSIAPFFDLVWLTSFETLPMFKKWGCNCCFLPYAANPHTFYPLFEQEIHTVGFIGTPYGSRVEKINTLINAGISCTVYSDVINQEEIVQKKIKNIYRYIKLLQTYFELSKFSIGRKVLLAELYKKGLVKPLTLNIESDNFCCNPSVSFEEMKGLYSNFSLSLGITELWNTNILSKPIHKLHLRTFEIPMCGGLQLVSYTEELADYFDDGKEIVFYSSREEYLDKAKFYLSDNNDKLRLKMKKAARFRAENEHSWGRRFDKIFEVMNLLNTKK